MIRFGSQVDLLIPATPGLEIVAKVGDEVTAGETVLVTRRPGRTESKQDEAQHEIAGRIG